MKSIKENLDFINTWITKNLQIRHQLAEGATKMQLLDLESCLGKKLHPSLWEALSLHNGQREWAFPFHDGTDICGLLSTEKIKESYQHRENSLEELREDNENEIKAGLIPIFQFPTGDYWSMDISSGEMYYEDHESGKTKHCESLAYFLDRLVNWISIGRIYVKGKRPYIHHLDDIWKQIDQCIPKILDEKMDEFDEWDDVRKFEDTLKEYFQIAELPSSYHYVRSHTLFHNGQKKATPAFLYKEIAYEYLSLREIQSLVYQRINSTLPICPVSAYPIFRSENYMIWQGIFQNQLVEEDLANNHFEILTDSLEDFLQVCLNHFKNIL
jgi:cell wall assembly regulator SMI1